MCDHCYQRRMQVAKSALIVLLSLCLVLAGCSTWRAVPVQDAPATLRQGDRIQVTMKSGEVRTLRFEQIDGQTLAGTDTRPRAGDISVMLSLAEVQALEKRRFSIGRTAALTGGVIVGVAAALLALIAYHATHCPDYGCE